MENNLFYSGININENNSTFLEKIREYSKNNPLEQIYIY